MKTLAFSFVILSAGLSIASAQVLYDPTDPAKQSSIDSERAKAGKLKTRDQNGTFQVKDGIVRAQGGTQFIKGGKMTRVTSEMKLSEGFVIQPDGKVKKPDGTTVQLEEGQMLMLDGRMTQAPASTGTTARGTIDPAPARSGNLTDFGQSGNNPKGPEGNVATPAK